MSVGIEPLRGPRYEDFIAPSLYLIERDPKEEKARAERLGGFGLAAKRKVDVVGSLATGNEVEQLGSPDQPQRPAPN